MSTHTIQTVRAFVEAHRESDEPDAILEVLKANAGKKYTVHLLRKLPGGEERWRLDPSYGMTHLEERRNDGAFRFLVSYNGSGPHVIDPAWVEKHNACYFSARRERNALRDKTSSILVSGMAERMADTLNTYETAKAALDEAKAQLDKLTGYGKSFSPDSSAWERLCGAREERK